MKMKIITLIMAGLFTNALIQAEDAEIHTADALLESAPVLESAPLTDIAITDVAIAPINAEYSSAQPIAITTAEPIEQTKDLNTTITQEWGSFQWIIDWIKKLWS